MFLAKHRWHISFTFYCSFIYVVHNIIDIGNIMNDMGKYYLYKLLGIFTFLREELIAYNLLR